MPYRTTRRNFLQGGCAVGVAFWLRRAEAFAQGAPAPKRLFIIHHPVGTIRTNWVCQGTETNFTLSRILAPFEPVKSHMVVLDGTLSTVPALTARLQQNQLFEQCFADRTLSFALTIATDTKEMCLRPNGATVPATATMRDLVLAVAQSPAFNDRTQAGP